MSIHRDSTFDILKGMGIILMVIGHSGAPMWMHDFIYSFHMPLFFIASGWFFSERSLDNKREYAQKKVKGLYIPYLKWSLIFLLLHNIFFTIGLLNSQYGYHGSVERWYQLNDFISHFLDICFLMTGYDSMLGTYWFMRSLFVASLLVCILSWFFMRISRQSRGHCIIATSLLCCLVGGAISYCSFKIPVVPQGGYREMMATFFIGMGYMLNKSEAWRSCRVMIISAVAFILCVIMHPTAMRGSVSFTDWYVIIVSGTAGFIVTYHMSRYISSHETIVRTALVYIGKRTFYIMTFHFLCFKPASLLKAWLYDMDWQVVGYHPVIPPVDDYWFWIVYAVSALFFSLLLERIISSMHFPIVLYKH